MKLSFITTAFNRPLALRTCLSSLVQQTMPEWEAIIVDNSDNPDDVMRHLELCKMDPRIRYKYTGSDTAIIGSIHTRSLYCATEIGAGTTTSPWLCLPNDDSYYCPWFAERMLEAAERNGWDLVYCDLIAGGAGGHWLLEARPLRCCIDKTNFIIQRDWFQGFTRKEGTDYPQADGMLIEELVQKGIKHGRVPQVLVVHN